MCDVTMCLFCQTGELKYRKYFYWHWEVRTGTDSSEKEVNQITILPYPCFTHTCTFINCKFPQNRQGPHRNPNIQTVL